MGPQAGSVYKLMCPFVFVPGPGPGNAWTKDIWLKSVLLKLEERKKKFLLGKS